MIWRTLTFRARPAEAAAVEKAIIAFVAKVADEPGTLRYESFRQADGVSYLHLMSFADDDAEREHHASEHMKRFLAELSPKCEAQPAFADLKMVSGAGR
jgi:quinol monooxygenase YgiN